MRSGRRRAIQNTRTTLRASAFRRMLVLALLAGIGICAPRPPAAAAAGPACPKVKLRPASLPNSQAALKANEELIVVAFGSSSTQGWMASNPGHTYPAILQEALSFALPQVHVAVINRGIGGQDATEEVARLDKDVLALRPNLVVWQVGANGALRSTDPAAFRQLVTAGTQRMHRAHADVILMDNQRAPRIMAAPENLVIDQSLADVATATNANLFARSSLMDAWKEQGADYSRFISSDGLHHNDLGYACLADALADTITAGLVNPSALQASGR
jgi:acyl-CoA thioesterase-1